MDSRTDAELDHNALLEGIWVAGQNIRFLVKCWSKYYYTEWVANLSLRQAKFISSCDIEQSFPVATLTRIAVFVGYIVFFEV